jgi:peroxiredoxin Q/BCP
MASRAQQKEQHRAERQRHEAELLKAQRARKLRLRIAGALVAAAVGLGAIFVLGNSGGHAKAGRYPYAVGDPGPGKPAPPIELPATDGSTFNLASQRGRTVMVYFQEGLSCQPCWDQLRDMEHEATRLRALGIQQVVSVTSDPLSDLRQKVRDEGLKTPVLSDSNLIASRGYSANRYGMMGESRDGHSFVVIGPDGRVRWRADYGGPPNFTMFVPMPSLLTDLQKGLGGTAP